MPVVVFDLDDTLFPESDYVASGFRAVGGYVRDSLGIDGFAETAIDLYRDGQRRRVFDDVLERFGVAPTEELVGTLVAHYREHTPDIRLYPDAEWALRHFRPSATLCVITDGYLAAQRRKVLSLGIEPLVDVIVYSDEFGRENWKPSPVPYRRVMDLTGSGPHDCVYIGDNSTKDFVTAKRLGWSTVHVAREDGVYFHVVAPESHVADYRIGSLRDLDRILSGSLLKNARPEAGLASHLPAAEPDRFPSYDVFNTSDARRHAPDTPGESAGGPIG